MGGNSFNVVKNVLHTVQGEGISHVFGDFLDISVLNPDFWCTIKFKLSSILAENVS